MAELNDRQLEQLHCRLGAAGVTEVRRLAGGASSLTFAGTLDGKTVVVKVAPPGLEPVLHRDVLRQARAIDALRSCPVPVPEILRQDRGAPPDEPPLFVMTFVDGESVEPLFDLDAAARDPTVMADRLRHAAVVLAQLHRLEPATLGLGAEPSIALTEEIDRWCRSLSTVDPALVAGWQDVATALRSTLPPPWRTGLCHGDFRLGNLLATDERITAVIDWEIWSMGDPRVDAGWFLINADPDTYRRNTSYSGTTPAPAELADIYAATLGCAVPELDWFSALALFKSAATWSLIVKLNRRQTSPRPDLEAMAAAPQSLLARASRLVLDGSPLNGG
jgi:aminoglycoside phosphotransferase (APT) family kinase protein